MLKRTLPQEMRPRLTLSEDRYAFAAQRLAELRDTLPAPVVFDIGCGDARMQVPATEAGLEWRGFDQVAWRLADAWDLNRKAPTKDKAGAVLLLDVIEHCVNPGLALQNLSAAMATGGVLVLTVPNPRWSGARVLNLAKGYTSGFEPHDLAFNHHVFTPWPHILAKLLADAGFAIEDYVTLDGWTNPLRQRLSPLYPLRVASGLLRLGIELADPTARGMSYAFVCRRG